MLEFKIVVIENPYDLIQENEEACNFLTKIFKMKLDGYRPYYDYGILPLGETDFYGNHIALCVVENGELEPVMAFKSVTTNDCKRMGKEFALYEHMIAGEQCLDHKNAAKEWVENLSANGEAVGYNHSWTICPKWKKNKEVRTAAMELTHALMYRYYFDYNIPHMILGCSTKYKVYKIMEFVGFNYLSGSDGQLGNYTPDGFKGEEFVLMHIENMNHSKEVKDLYKKYESLWNARIVFSPAAASKKSAA